MCVCCVPYELKSVFIVVCKIISLLSLLFKQLHAALFCLCSFPIGCMFRRKEIWLFRERGNDARDNAYWMFRYIKERHPEIEAYYAITKDSPDRRRLARWEASVLDQNSFRHYLYMWRATHMLSTHICGGYPNMVRGSALLYYIVTWLSPKKTIWLQHGVILNDLDIHVSRYNNPDMIVSSTRSEYEYLNKLCGYTDKVVKLTGLARFDQLHDCQVKRNQILFMPTWRKWLNKDNFSGSEYFRVIAGFLMMPQLHSFLEEKALTLVFYPHHVIQNYIHHFSNLSLPASIIIADKAHYDIQTLLKESALMITDYSSASMDFVYMKKPLVYFLFDEDKFREGHYASSAFDYRDAFGPYSTNAKDLLYIIQRIHVSGMKMDSGFVKKVEQTFPFDDRNNCKRIFSLISELD